MYHGNPIKVFLAAVAISVLALMGAGQAAAASLRVCSDASKCYTSIQVAINAASEGDTIKIDAGTYDGNLTIEKSVTLVGADADQTTITQSESDSVITVSAGVSVTIEAVTVRGGHAVVDIPEPGCFGSDGGLGGGINNSGALALRDSRVSDNTADTDGGGIFNSGTATLTLYDSTVSANRALCSFDLGVSAGGGIANLGTATLHNSTVSGNSAVGFVGVGGGINNASGALTLKESRVSGNGNPFSGGGISNSGTAALFDSTVSDNSALFGGGGISNAGTLTLKDSRVTENSASEGDGGGIANSGTSANATLFDSMVSGNIAAGNGGGIYNTATLALTGSSVTGNRAGVVGGGIYNSGGLVMLTNSTVSGNIPDDCVGC
jgi:hypothetical protein